MNLPAWFWDVACAFLLGLVIWLYRRLPRRGAVDFKTWTLMPATPTREMIGGWIIICAVIFAILIAAQFGLMDKIAQRMN